MSDAPGGSGGWGQAGGAPSSPEAPARPCVIDVKALSRPEQLGEDLLGTLADVLGAGHVIALPTDTVYGLAVSLAAPGATAALFEAKRRPGSVALAVLVADVDQAESLATLSAPALAVARQWWPGPLTLVLPRRDRHVAADLGGDGRTVGLRVPAHPVARGLCSALGPLVTTSANLHGEPPSELAEDIVAALRGAVRLVLDGGRCGGVPSTVVDFTGARPRCLRAGGVPFRDVERVASQGASRPGP